MKSSWLVTHRGGDVTPARSGRWGIWPGSPCGAGNDLTEGKSDARQTKQMEEIPTMKKALAVAGLGAAITVGALMGAGAANATPRQDSEFIACTSAQGLYNNTGTEAGAGYGRTIAYHISSGLRNPLQERNHVYHETPSSITLSDANVLVNCATTVYLGFGPNDPVPNYGESL